MRCGSWRRSGFSRQGRGARPEPSFAQIVRGAARTAHSLRPMCERDASPTVPARLALVRSLQSHVGMTSALKRILVATDFSEGSDEALTQAIELGKQTGASLEIVYVRELGGDGFPFGPLYPEDAGDVVAYADLELARRRDRVTSAGLQCHYRCLDGSAANEIVRRAGETKADLIVIGTHGRRGLAHAMLGSVAERVVQHASCPVLTVPFSKKAA